MPVARRNKMSNHTYAQMRMPQEFSNIRSEIGGVRSELGNFRNEIGNVRSEMGNVRNEIGSVRSEIGNVGRLLEERRSIEFQKEAIMTTLSFIKKAKNSYDKVTEKLDREEFENEIAEIEDCGNQITEKDEIERLKKAREEYIESQKKVIIERAKAKGYRVMEVKKDNKIQLTLVREVR